MNSILKPNILFIVIDSLRADRFNHNASLKGENINKLINTGVLFEKTFSTVGSTGSSIASIFTSLYPFKTGMSSEKYQKLHPEAINLVSILKENGYHTFSASPPLTSALGLIDNFKNNEKHHDNYYSLFSGLGDEIVSKLKQDEFKKPWFFYVHINDLHQPIIVPESFKNNIFGDTNYDKMIASIDDWIGKFLKYVDMNNTLVIITSDHGEYLSTFNKESNINFESNSIENFLWKMGNKAPIFMRPLKSKISKFLRNQRFNSKKSKLNKLEISEYEKRLLLLTRMSPGHHMFDDIIHVPLIFSGFGVSPNKIKELVRHIDIFPTIFELIDLKISHPIHGRSLVPFMKNKILDELPAYIESPPTIEQSRPKMIGLRSSNFKYIRSSKNPISNIELYDLKNDPYEQNNIAQKSPDIVNTYEKLLLKITENSLDENSLIEISKDHNKEIENELRKLGYI